MKKPTISLLIIFIFEFSKGKERNPAERFGFQETWLLNWSSKVLTYNLKKVCHWTLRLSQFFGGFTAFGSGGVLSVKASRWWSPTYFLSWLMFMLPHGMLSQKPRQVPSRNYACGSHLGRFKQTRIHWSGMRSHQNQGNWTALRKPAQLPG